MSEPPAVAGGLSSDIPDVQPPATAGGSARAKKLRRKTHQTIARVDEAISTLQFNTPVAGLMELCNALYDSKIEPETATDDERAAVSEAVRSLILMLTPFAPHFAEELYSEIAKQPDGIVGSDARFPEYIEEFARADEIEIAVQVNGKLRSRIFADPEASNEALQSQAMADQKVVEHTAGKEIVKVVVIPKRLVNVVVR